MIYVGIDLHSRKMTLVAINDNAKVLTGVKLTITPANLSRFFERKQPSSHRLIEKWVVGSVTDLGWFSSPLNSHRMLWINP